MVKMARYLEQQDFYPNKFPRTEVFYTGLSISSEVKRWEPLDSHFQDLSESHYCLGDSRIRNLSKII